MTQRGALFGLDLRMAIIIGGLMATVISAELLSRFEGDRQATSMQRVESVRNAILTRYASSATTTFDDTLTTLLSDGYLNDDAAIYAGSTGTQGAVDAWRQDLAISVVSSPKTLLGADVTSHFGVLVSSGADKVFQSPTTLADEAAFLAWAPAGDDISLKFNTILLDRNRVLLMQQQLKDIMAAMVIYAQRTESTVASTCEAANCGCTDAAPVTCTALGLDYCDRTGDGYHCNLEHQMMNFYPTNSVENISNPSLAYSTLAGLSIYTSGNLVSMQSLMTLLGLPTSYAVDAWGRTLNYNSNEYNTTATPYTASVWYQ